MSANGPWTGGLANREYRRGSHVEQPVDTDYIAGQVRGYLRDCRRFRLAPSEDMCLKVVFHATGDQERAVVDAYCTLTGTREP